MGDDEGVLAASTVRRPAPRPAPTPVPTRSSKSATKRIRRRRRGGAGCGTCGSASLPSSGSIMSDIMVALGKEARGAACRQKNNFASLGPVREQQRPDTACRSCVCHAGKRFRAHGRAGAASRRASSTQLTAFYASPSPRDASRPANAGQARSTHLCNGGEAAQPRSSRAATQARRTIVGATHRVSHLTTHTVALSGASARAATAPATERGAARV